MFGQATIPAEFLISFFLFGVEEVGMQIEVQSLEFRVTLIEY